MLPRVETFQVTAGRWPPGVTIRSVARRAGVAVFHPALPTVRQDEGALGREAARLLLALPGGDRAPAAGHVVITPELVVRGSTAAPPSMEPTKGRRTT
jgi:hypothetical protein